MSKTPSEIIEHFNMRQDADDPRWKGTSKQVWRSGRGRAGMPFMQWSDVDHFLEACILDNRIASDDGWYYVEGWEDGRYRAVWVNRRWLATFTYCEGDLILVTLGDAEQMLAELIDAQGYYGEPAIERYQPGILQAIAGVEILPPASAVGGWFSNED